MLPQNTPLSVLSSVTPPYPWEDDTYLIPVLEDDPLLQVDFCTEPSSCDSVAALSVIGNRTESESDYKEALSRALTDLESMR